MENEHFDTEAFFAALDAERQERGKTWKEVAAASGVSASTLTRMAQGRRPDVDGLAALLEWSGLKAESFIIKRGGRVAAKPATVAMISTHLRADPRLSAESANALEGIVRAAYKQLVKKD